MIIAGPCSFINMKDTGPISETATLLDGVVDYFRCKVWLGGTSPDRYKTGIGKNGLHFLTNLGLPFMTEVQVPKHIEYCKQYDVDAIWIGARNSQNYALLEACSEFSGSVFIKRNPGMTIKEIIGIYDIMDVIFEKKPYIIERGINTIDRNDVSRWSISLNSILEIKYNRPDIFKKLVVDCSHSAGTHYYVQDIYNATKAMGVQHFMFECTSDGFSETDFNHIINVKDLKAIIS